MYSSALTARARIRVRIRVRIVGELIGSEHAKNLVDLQIKASNLKPFPCLTPQYQKPSVLEIRGWGNRTLSDLSARCGLHYIDLRESCLPLPLSLGFLFIAVLDDFGSPTFKFIGFHHGALQNCSQDLELELHTALHRPIDGTGVWAGRADRARIAPKSKSKLNSEKCELWTDRLHRAPNDLNCHAKNVKCCQRYPILYVSGIETTRRTRQCYFLPGFS